MISRTEVERRDLILRRYFEERDWDNNNEYMLKRQLVLNSRTLLPDYQFVIDDEWEVEPNRPQAGKGDLIFSNGAGKYAVVEVKWLDFVSTGEQASNKRTRKRRTVRRQAEKYASSFTQLCIKSMHEGNVYVEGYYFTNEDSKPQRALL